MKRLNIEISIPFKEKRKTLQNMCNKRISHKKQVLNFPFINKNIQDKHLNKTAWIFGSGVSINDLNDLVIPKSDITFALNGGIVYFWKPGSKIKYTGQLDSSDYIHRLNYWMAFDMRVFDHRRLPEWDYTNIAMQHPTALKLFPHYLDCFNAENVYRYVLHKRQINEVVLTTEFDGRLFTGDSILIPCLHYCLITGFKRIILSGCDLCNLVSDKTWQRYCKLLLDMRWRGHHIPPVGRQITSPCGEKGRVTGMYKAQISETMQVIRFIQHCGIEVVKTSKRGMLDIPLWKIQ